MSCEGSEPCLCGEEGVRFSMPGGAAVLIVINGKPLVHRLLCLFRRSEDLWRAILQGVNQHRRIHQAEAHLPVE